MRVLLVDDEAQIRKGLMKKVKWVEFGYDEILEAANGVEALEVLQQYKIHLILTDIRMPRMDGVELAQKCHESYPNCKLVVLSGYSDFDYVKKAMQYGVRDYLLKPIAPDELNEMVYKMTVEINKELQKQKEIDSAKHFVHSYFHEVQEQYLLYMVKDEWLQKHLVVERVKQLQLDEILKQPYQLLTAELRGNSSSRVSELWYSFQLISRELTVPNKWIYAFINPSYRNVVHFLVLADDKVLATFIQSLLAEVKRLLRLELVIGIGNKAVGIENLKTSYISSLLAWSQSELGCQSQIIQAGEISKETVDVSTDSERILLHAIESLNAESFNKQIKQLFDISLHHSVWSFSYMANRILFLLSAVGQKYDADSQGVKELLWECQQSIWALQSDVSIIEKIQDLAKKIMENVRKARYSNGRLVVENIRQYMDEHYGTEITLTSLSEMFHMNNAYLSELFKEQIGENFSDYLTRIRMEKAQIFLQDEQLKIIDVANLVGYANSGYFSTVFKKYFKQTPVEYRVAYSDTENGQ
ncbi:response regulator [Lysinibacillus piscis]|uniref:DNA-binding response regulator n=1 Tax=Lysinibacillus piscis TaxID=2518931 RepID=A0ABQ5NMX3_9BACI|nr:response regulator [Lysinibacillus sp. KH24]GLC89657.1 DNA-binding response regulator [Lysinibacillus sp. KH24]